MRVSLWERPAQRVALMSLKEGERKGCLKKRINELALATGPGFSIIVKKKEQVRDAGCNTRSFEKR